MTTQPNQPNLAPLVVERAFTVKSIGVGIVVSLLIAWVNNFNTNYLRAPDLIGNQLPTGPVITILLLAAVWNPLVGRFVLALRFSVRELAVTLVLMFMCCCIPASGLFRYFQRGIVMPVIVEPAHPDWQRVSALSYIPEHLFPLLRDPERFAQVAAVETAGPADPTLRALLLHVPPAAFGATVPTAVEAGEMLSRTHEAVARAARTDAKLQAVMEVAGELQRVVPSADEVTPYAVAFRPVREAYVRILPEARHEYDRVYPGFIQGLSVGDRALPLADLPWRPWLTAMAWWAPLILLMLACSVSLGLVLHRQWSRHEQIAYPLAGVATSLIQTTHVSLVPDILRNRLFWWGATPVLLLHLLNVSALYHPSHVPRVDLSWSIGWQLHAIFPVLNQVGDPRATWGQLYFMVVGLAYFVSSEMSLSMGLSSIALLLLNVQVYTMTGGTVDAEASRGGAYFAYAAILLYGGRTYYLAVLRKAFGFGLVAEDDHEPVWAARIFIAAFVGFVALLAGPFGMDWFIALLFALTVMVLFLVISRIICESGVPFMQAAWYPGTLLASTLGVSALGAAPLVMACYLSPILAYDPREALLPYVQNGLRIAENVGVRRTPLAWLGFGAIAISLVICFISWTKGIYQDGSYLDGDASRVPAAHLDVAVRGLGQLTDTGQLDQAEATHGLAKIGMISSLGHERALVWFWFGAAAVVSFSVLRFSTSWWPFHPVMLLVWDSYAGGTLWPSFLLGWAVKSLVVRFAGGSVYTKLKPLFLGLIIGELLAIGGVLILGWTYWLRTGLLPKPYWILPY